MDLQQALNAYLAENPDLDSDEVQEAVDELDFVNQLSVGAYDIVRAVLARAEDQAPDGLEYHPEGCDCCQCEDCEDDV